MAKGNEDRGGLPYLAAVRMRVVAEDCRFMLHLATPSETAGCQPRIVLLLLRPY